MSQCIHHPSRPSVVTINLKNYCAECQQGVIAARRHVSQHVEPKDCFVWYVGRDSWQPIGGTGCAHWVAHQRGIQSGAAAERCLEGYTYRVKTLIQGLPPVEVQNVQVNDIYVMPAMDHTGLVVNVVPNSVPGKPPLITIRHDSSNQGRVADNDFASYFHGQGTFYR
jgi:hypothetical protein